MIWKLLDLCEGSWMYIFVQNYFSSEDVVVTIDMWKITFYKSFVLEY